MKKTIAAIALLASTLSFAGSTNVIWVRGGSAAEVEQKMFDQVQDIQGKHRIMINGSECVRPKVYAASAPAKHYRANRFGELEAYWSATIKVSCQNND
ncbi:MAG: hypothetical protein EP326_08050 [Deltaproteobacteria bacterium]|jgi:hypothetical protein|nr:MAG: hypothetical protein EP326_08050 [Deltaproteobacteria bacterium]TNF28637.1 MAG: hypothetical protein EP319_08575 [Deltaproteobacteria bacterium]